MGPKMVHLSYCLKIHPIAVFSVMTALDLLRPFAFVKKQAACNSSLQGHLKWIVTSTR